jgi:hypothetical protein
MDACPVGKQQGGMSILGQQYQKVLALHLIAQHWCLCTGYSLEVGIVGKEPAASRKLGAEAP